MFGMLLILFFITVLLFCVSFTALCTLQDTNRNINAVDGLLEDYKDINEKQSKAIERVGL